ncbi:peptidyl-prolyl cis-trans isomerase FKBP16-1, chloroplastic isoform X1 [Eucalyptus grandis]|uniref:peptidyl-prolyl cis-trans isomerase FKBP16-1, chloroplastic isoform X1 n=1 Tax=Eucalyptus grandis TaxID=71139 RepID=UPI00192F0DF7|nr:peptidyl-prolyl cis-trans isomerase FKBP16-1, chloroplastic isoform X1 [Eucalyptus grandis]
MSQLVTWNADVAAPGGPANEEPPRPTKSLSGGASSVSFSNCSECVDLHHHHRVIAVSDSLPPIPECTLIVCIKTQSSFHALPADLEVFRTSKLPDGVRFQEIVEGEGPEAHDGDLVEVNYVCRRSNGYFVHSTVDQFSGESMPILLPLDENQIIKGLKEILIGMKVGGKRRGLIPPSVGYINENLKPIPDEFGPQRSLLSHAKEPLIFEVQLLKVL